ncbi:MAG: 5-methyltetrahydrofolate--homocysteine methyltransferase [Prevotella sp.]|nr:5-methyltetrahydrofolate--homocysteine methyltransferase [Prevotella sp.]
MKIDYCLQEVAPYINWLYFDHAWGLSGKPEAERLQVRQEAEERLKRYADHYKTHAVFGLFCVHRHDDDILFPQLLFPCLRQQQQGSDFLCLADFIAVEDDMIGVFATSVDVGMETDFDDDPYEKMMMQLLADRLAEATAERLHRDVRTTYWGYAKGEQLSMEELLTEQWQGIRPAIGYPSLPDTSLNFLIDQLIDMRQIGIQLTETGAMKPHASVSGLMISHPEARYFSIGKIGEDQLTDYAVRRGLDIDETRKYLQAIL